MNTFKVQELLKYTDDILGYNIFDYFDGTLILYQTFFPIFSEVHFKPSFRISSYYYRNDILFYPVNDEEIIFCDIKSSNIQFMNRLINKKNY